jgi:hypothetical protein
MRPLLATLALALLTGGCALIAGIGDHSLASGGGGGTAFGPGCTPLDKGPTACTGTLADCDGDGTCETNLTISRDHCGACNHACLGGECSASACQEVALTPNADPAQAFGPMALFEDRVYFAAGPHDANAVYRVPVGGGPSTQVCVEGSSTPVGEVHHLLGYPTADGDLLLYTAYRDGAWNLYGVLPDAGTPAVFAALTERPIALAASAKGFLFVASQSHVDFISNEGPKSTVSSSRVITSLAVDDDHLYWSSYPDGGGDGHQGTVSRADYNGNDIVDLATDLATPESIAVDGDAVYWVDSTRGEVATAPKAQKGAATRLTTGQNAPNLIAVRGQDLYFAGEDGVFRLPLCASARATQVTHLPAGGLSIDDQRLYLTEMHDHRVLAFAR